MMIRSTRAANSAIAAVAATLLLAGPAAALDQIVEKKVFEMGAYRTVGGGLIKNVRIGYETYGTLNAASDNAILVPHFFSANSHLAGKYKADDRFPGYWDAIVGPGKPLDTDKFFIIGVDSLVNLNTKDPNTITTGPVSIDPDTGKPYGTTFPVVSIRDFVNTQRALIDKLGVKRLHAAMGASMGAIQSYEWAAAFPDMVPRLISVIGSSHADGWTIARLQSWADPILMDPEWKGGMYHGGPEPIVGLTKALKMVNIDARAPQWAEASFGRKLASNHTPATRIDHAFAIEEWNETAAKARASTADANHFLYLVRANQLHALNGAATREEGLRHVKAKVLLLPDHKDMLLLTEGTRAERDILERQGNKVVYQELQGALGHLDGVVAIAQAADTITKFLAD